jgi:AcrR family transcriptional regulator
MSRVPTGVYRGIPADQRRAERRARLMDAALDIMGTQGWSATTVRGVCQHARLTPRFFYESFSDLEALAVAVFDDIVASATANVIEAMAAAPDDMEAKARAAIGTFVRDVLDDPRRARVAFREALGSEPLMQRRLATMRMMADLIATQARASYKLPATTDPFVDLTAALLAGGMAELLIVWLEGDLPLDREQLVEDCVALSVAMAESAAEIARKRARKRRR